MGAFLESLIKLNSNYAIIFNGKKGLLLFSTLIMKYAISLILPGLNGLTGTLQCNFGMKRAHHNVCEVKSF